MLKKSSILVLPIAVMLIVGCESNTGTGVLIGGASGAAIGGLAGGGTGALIGSAAGVITGGLIGAYLDNQESKTLREHSSETYRRIDNGEKLSVHDIINLSKANIGDDKIIRLIEKTHSDYRLDRYQIDRLRDAGVSERVINYMIYAP